MDGDFDVDLSDLSVVLAHYGCTGTCIGDLDLDGDVDLADLAILLAHYGIPCCPSGTPGGPPSGSVTITVQSYDTGSYSGSGFYGESVDFVFDVLEQVSNSSDDWTGMGTEISTCNGAVILLVPGASGAPIPGSTTPEKYATFFSVPFSNLNGSSRFNSPFPTGGLAGKHSASTGAATYTTSSVDAVWYDLNPNSNDGPAGVMRVVFDVSGVSGANTTGGLGSVYFSTTGAASGSDIKIADATFQLGHSYANSGSASLTGEFYVKG